MRRNGTTRCSRGFATTVLAGGIACLLAFASAPASAGHPPGLDAVSPAHLELAGIETTGVANRATCVSLSSNPSSQSTEQSQALEVTVLNGVSGQTIPRLQVDAFERLPKNGDLVWHTSAETDESGVAIFHLDGLGNGRAYVLRARPYDGGDVYSRVIETPGAFHLSIGMLRVAVLDGSNNRPLVDYRIDVREIVDGKMFWAKSGISDRDGILRLDLPGLGQGRRYRLEARSPIDGSRKYSNEITENGFATFVVGNPPLRLRAIDKITGIPLTAVRVSVREVMEQEHKTIWINTRSTDDDGNVSFDVDGLGEGRAFVLEAKLADGSSVRTEPVSTPGDYTFELGRKGATVAELSDGSIVPVERMVAYDRQ